MSGTPEGSGKGWDARRERLGLPPKERTEQTTVNFPIPLRPGVVAQLRVPWDLTKEEAEKILRVVTALVKD